MIKYYHNNKYFNFNEEIDYKITNILIISDVKTNIDINDLNDDHIIKYYYYNEDHLYSIENKNYDIIYVNIKKSEYSYIDIVKKYYKYINDNATIIAHTIFKIADTIINNLNKLLNFQDKIDYENKESLLIYYKKYILYNIIYNPPSEEYKKSIILQNNKQKFIVWKY